MREIEQQVLTGERALFMSEGLRIRDCVFEDGESPLKESRDLEVRDSIFRWKYPFWYCENVTASRCTFLEMSRSGMWYTRNIRIEDCAIEAPKDFRKSQGVHIVRTSIPHADETLWWCADVQLDEVSACGDYFGQGCTNVRANGFQLIGNYAFDGGRDIRVENARMASKDAFWNCENVHVKNSVITGEYLGWNSRNLVFEDCTIESLQGFCYIDGLVLRNCKLVNTTLAFEYCSNIDIDVDSRIDSVKNPRNGVIRAREIGEQIWDDPAIDPSMTAIELTR